MLIRKTVQNLQEQESREAIENQGFNASNTYHQFEVAYLAGEKKATMIHEFYKNYEGLLCLNVWLIDYDEMVCIAHVPGKKTFMPPLPSRPGTQWYSIRDTLAEYFNNPEIATTRLDVYRKPVEKVLVSIIKNHHVLVAGLDGVHSFVTIRREHDLPYNFTEMIVSKELFKEEQYHTEPTRLAGGVINSSNKQCITQILFNRNRKAHTLVAGIHKTIKQVELIYEKADGYGT